MTIQDDRVFWNKLLFLADELNASDDPPGVLGTRLLAIEEGFSGAFDPAENFPGYVALALCRGMRRRLENA